ncbi:hypothetical protein Hanom_Chr11g01044821 [Helianthus anomalus]
MKSTYYYYMISFFNTSMSIKNKNTCRTNAEDDSEKAAPKTIASSILLMFTCDPFQLIISDHNINERAIPSVSYLNFNFYKKLFHSIGI